MENQPNCPSCNETGFRAAPTPIVGAPGVRLVACASCGTLVGVVPEETDNRLKDIEAKVNAIVERMKSPALKGSPRETGLFNPSISWIATE